MEFDIEDVDGLLEDAMGGDGGLPDKTNTEVRAKIDNIRSGLSNLGREIGEITFERSESGDLLMNLEDGTKVNLDTVSEEWKNGNITSALQEFGVDTAREEVQTFINNAETASLKTPMSETESSLADTKNGSTVPDIDSIDNAVRSGSDSELKSAVANFDDGIEA